MLVSELELVLLFVSDPELLLPEFKLLVSVLEELLLPDWMPPGEVAAPLLLLVPLLNELPVLPELEFVFILPLLSIVPEVEPVLF